MAMMTDTSAVEFVEQESDSNPNLQNIPINIQDRIHIATVFEDCVDQLAILGTILPISLEHSTRADYVEKVVGEEISKIIEGQRQLESKFEKLVLGKEGRDRKSNLLDNENEYYDVTKSIKSSTQALGRSLKTNPLGTDILLKMQDDRGFLQDIMENTLAEIVDHGTFNHMTESVKGEQKKRSDLLQIIQKEEAARKKVKTLQKQLLEVRRDKEIQIQQRSEMIAHLKDQLQEMKAKTSMEGKYIKKESEVRVICNQKKCQKVEQELNEEYEDLQGNIDDENRINTEIEAYLETQHKILEEKVEYWMEKYEKDVEAKQNDLDTLKSNRANDLARLQELTQLYQDYEEVVVQDRLEKEKARKLEEQRWKEMKAATKIQSWWRGVMVRKRLRSKRKKKKGKGKKGKKGKGKGKGKGKAAPKRKK